MVSCTPFLCPCGRLSTSSLYSLEPWTEGVFMSCCCLFRTAWAAALKFWMDDSFFIKSLTGLEVLMLKPPTRGALSPGFYLMTIR